MGAVVKLILHAPRASLEEFFTAQSFSLGERLRGIAPEADYAGPLIKAVDELSDEEHAQLTVNAERVTEMADEVGQSALLAVVQKRFLVEGLENGYARSLWVFLNEQVSFQRAEEIRYTEQHREGRSWNGYAAPAHASYRRGDARRLQGGGTRALRFAEQGERSKARGVLAPIYGCFTEGFDTPDLTEARASLEALSRSV